MGDSEAAAQDKTKEKKKKKSGSTKEKEPKKKSVAESDPQSDAKQAPPEDESPKSEPVVVQAQPEPAAAAAATADGEAPPEAAKKTKKKSVSKESAEAPTTASDSANEGRKASVAEGATPQQEGAAALAGASRKASAVEGAIAEAKAEDEPPPKRSPDDIPIIGTTYVPPPPATKHDIDLLEDMDKNKLMELKELFEIFDYDQDGYIDFKDLKLTYQTLGYPDVPEEDIENMLAEAMSPLDFDGFVILLGYKTIEMDPESVLVEALACWDFDNTGLIPEERIKHDIMTWGDKFTEEEAELALEDAPIYTDKKGVPMIDYLKFSNNLCGLRKKSRQTQPEGNA